MKLGVLGPLSLVTESMEAGANPAPSTPKLRSVPAMVIVYGDQVVPVTTSMRELWDEVPPSNGSNRRGVQLLSAAPAVFHRLRGKPNAELGLEPGRFAQWAYG